MQHKAPGFQLLEILLVLMVVGILATITLTSFLKDTTRQDIINLHQEINNLVLLARQEAIFYGIPYRLRFAAGKYQLIVLEKEAPNPEKPGTMMFIPATDAALKNMVKLPETLQLSAFYEERKELFSENKQVAFCYVLPNGLLPNLLVHLRATKSKLQATLKSEPFLGTFSLHNAIILPPKKGVA